MSNLPNEVRLNDVPLRVQGAVSVALGGGWPGKVVTGATDKDSHPTLSTWVMGDWTGGLGVSDFKEGVEQARYRYATLNARHPYQLSLPLATRDLGFSGSAFNIGDDYDGTVYDNYVASASFVYKNTTNIGALIRTPDEEGVVFQGTATQRRIFVACGNGYFTITPDTNTVTDVPTPDIRCFAVWDNKLIGVHADGTLWSTVAANVALTQISGAGGTRLPPDAKPKRIHVYRDRNDDQVPLVVTNKGIWVFDPDTPKLYPVPEISSPHPDFGRASCVWGDLWVSSGLDVFRWNGSARLQVGLSRDHGLPSRERGTIVALIPGSNSMYAIVQRGTSSAAAWAVYEFTESAWHFIADDTLVNRTGPITGWGITRSTRLSANAYDLYWMIGSSPSPQTAWQQLSKEDFNPREAIEDGTLQYGNIEVARGGYMQTGWFDANMARYPKIANAVELRVEKVQANNWTVAVGYRINDATAFTDVLTTSIDGLSTVVFGANGLGDGVASGVTFERIEFQITFLPVKGAVTATLGTTPIVESVVLSYLKPNPASRSFTFTPDLSATFYDRSPEDTLDFLVATKHANQFVKLTHRGEHIKGHMLIASGPENPGIAEAFNKTITVVEVRDTIGT